MIWLRKGIAYLLSAVLLVSLVGVAQATSAEAIFTHPSKIESWLKDSNLYGGLEAAITENAQKSVSSSSSGTTPASDPAVLKAAQSAFPQSLLEQSVVTFVNSNYAWLEGKSTTPNFAINLSSAKQNFANEVGQAVETHLASLPACTPTQSIQQQDTDPLLLTCRPTGVTPQDGATQITEQIAITSDFLSNPVITANNLDQSAANQSEPYYQKFSEFPKAYQWSEKLPAALASVAALCVVCIFFIAPQRRQGMRQISVVLLLSGLLLLADRALTDEIFSEIQKKAFNSISSGQVQQPLITFTHQLETQLGKMDLWFAIGYLVASAIIICFLLATRGGRKKPKAASTPLDIDKSPHGFSASDIHLANRHQQAPSPDITSAVPRVTNSSTPQAQRPSQPPRRPRPPKLIQ